MDKAARLAHLEDLLQANASLRAHLDEHRAKLEAHHASGERDRALTHTNEALSRAEKEQRSLERAIRNDAKQHSS